ncbi:winged helix-turn-helix domain-containing protein [Hafnia alvei]|uniref:DNA-binding winged helix-turn-helix (WHTH) domain-containing protein n=1 Tax=Hafnia alvei TaxID=569 RepID=A0A1C6YW19_HAFAL|nr:transcriptional regulator [Hafnia alvei]NLS56142.1 transcriptional regulator [Hafnia alvei]SCM51080.1 DNA-binding winged helix-turn-helix (wHTH) domain-containing protein [Hafnia alvei]
MNDVSKDDTIFILGDGIRFEPEKRCLINDFGTVINLPENSYRFLLLLLEGETDKQNIINQVWHEQRGSVSDSSYYGQIYMLRKSFDQIGLSSAFIKTIPRKGVKYMGNVLREKKFLPDSGPEANAAILSLATSTGLTDAPTSPLEAMGYAYQKEPSNSGKEWYHSRRWNVFISILSLLAVCWISTLVVVVILFFAK